MNHRYLERHLMIVIVIVIVALLDDLVHGEAQFESDCSDGHYQYQIECRASRNEEGVCSTSSPFSSSIPSNGAVGKAHDFRVSHLTKASPRRPDQYQLAVDISWQPPTDYEWINHLHGFRLRISPPTLSNTTCFFFAVSLLDSDSSSTDKFSPRFRFSSMDLFDFSLVYDLQLDTLFSPPSPSSPSVFLRTRMPDHPIQGNEKNDSLDQQQFNCSRRANSAASRWVAGFRRIFVHSLAKTIQLEFVGAPPSLCFEAYELRLLDETGMELLHHAIIEREQMKEEMVDGRMLLFGEYNFTGLDLDKDYRPAVLPVERARDGRCLCPVLVSSSGKGQGDNVDPYDSRLVCSCLAAEWKTVRLQRLIPPQSKNNNSTMDRTSSSIVPSSSSFSSSLWSVLLGIVVVIVLVGLCLLLCFALNLYRHYRAKGKIVRIRLIAASDRHHSKNNSNKTIHGDGTPLVTQDHRRVLLIYSQDGALHESAVIALAEFLRDVCFFDVQLDKWQLPELALNQQDYVTRTVQRADRIVVVNSIGANCRYQARALDGEKLERIEASPTDALFLSQLDHALQFVFLSTFNLFFRRPDLLVSTRFTYSTEMDVLPTLRGRLQFVIPTNLNALLSALTIVPVAPSASSSSPQLTKLKMAVERMRDFQRSNQNWFISSHCRVPIAVPIVSVVDEQEREESSIETEEETSSVKPLILPVPEEIEIMANVKPSLSMLVDDVDKEMRRIDERIDSGIVSDHSFAIISS